MHDWKKQLTIDFYSKISLKLKAEHLKSGSLILIYMNLLEAKTGS